MMEGEEGMKTSFKLLTVLLSAFCLFNTDAMADADDSPEEIQEADIEFPTLGPNPQREYCMLYWNKHYKDNMIDIRVSTEGRYDEVVVFTCPGCSLEEHYVEPFLNTKIDGVSGAGKIKECGFTKAKFQGARGIQEIGRVLLTDVKSASQNALKAGRPIGPIDPVNRWGAVYGDDYPFETLDSVSAPVGEVSEDIPFETEPLGDQETVEKPLGVREAEGRPIGE